MSSGRVIENVNSIHQGNKDVFSVGEVIGQMFEHV